MSIVVRVREGNTAPCRSRKLRGRPRTVWVRLSTWGPWGRQGRGIWGNSAPGIRRSTCESLKAGMRSVCVGRRPVWLELSGRRERVAGAVGEVGRGPQIVLLVGG